MQNTVKIDSKSDGHLVLLYKVHNYLCMVYDKSCVFEFVEISLPIDEQPSHLFYLFRTILAA